MTLNLSSSSVNENGGSSRITASLSSPSSAMTTLTVTAAPGTGADSGDYSLSGPTLTITPGVTTSAGALTVSAIDNAIDAPDKTVSISGGASNALGVIDPAAVTLTIADDDATPTVTLDLNSSSIGENSGTASVTASLSGASSQDVTVVVSASPVSPAVSGDFTITSNKTLTIPAGSAGSTGTVTITGIDNSLDEPDKSVTLTATVSGGRGVSAPSSRMLTITDDEGTPTVTLGLSPSSISENGGTASVTASLSGPSSQDVTVVVSASPVSPAVSGDFTITSNKTLTIPAGSTGSTGTVTIMGIDNSVDEPDKSVTVTATVRGGRGVSAPSSRMLTITDDDAAPTVTLDLSSSSISEKGGTASVTASLSGASSQDVTVVVSASPVSPAVSGGFTITSNKTLTIPAGSTGSTGTVTIMGIDNSVDEPDKPVTVSATVSGRGVSAPSSQSLTITDDEGTPTVTLDLSSSSISENGGTANVTTSLSGPSSQDVTVVVSESPISPTVSGDFIITSNKTLTIPAGSTGSTGTVIITGVDNTVDAPDKSVTVAATVRGHGVSAPSSQTLTILDDDAAPAVTLNLSSSSIGENGGVANVTASLSGLSSQDVILTVSAIPVSPAVSGDFTITSNNTLTIPAGSTGSTGTVTITGVDNNGDEPDKSVTLTAMVSGGRGVSAPSSRMLTITDDDAAPTVTLDLSSSSISENSGTASVTASLSGASSQDVTVVVSASPVSPAVSGDFTITSNKTLTIPAGSTSSTGTVTITGVDNSVDAPDKSVTLTATVSGGRGVSAPSSQSLTITDDDATPKVTLHLSPSSISENGGTASVTASLSGPSSQDVTVVVSASPVSPTVSGDFTITSNKTLTIAAGSTSSTGTVIITGVDNSVDAPDKTVTVAATVSGHGVSAPSSRTLTIRDGEGTPTVTLDLSPSSISENGGTTSVAASLSGPSSQDVTLTVSAIPISPTVSGDFTITSNKTLTIAAGSTISTGTVTITGVDNSVDAPRKSITVTATVSGGRGVSAPSGRMLNIRDDEETPTVTLNLSSSSISENGGTANVTASLSGPSSQDVTLTVSAIPISPTVSGDFTITSNKTLTILAGSTGSTGTVTIKGVDNSVDEPDKPVIVGATVSGGHGVSAPSLRHLTIRDDDAAPTVTLDLSSSSISENGGVANVAASLSGPSSQDVTAPALPPTSTLVPVPAPTLSNTSSSTSSITTAPVPTATPFSTPSATSSATGVGNGEEGPPQ